MKAGRELDALVAEKVMGWDLVPTRHLVRLRYFRQPGTDSRAARERCYLPRYSEDIAAAWGVVEKLSGYERKLEECSEGWCFTFEAGEEFWGQADTAPLAICLAALKAVGVDV